MARAGVIIGGFFLVVIAGIGYFYPINDLGSIPTNHDLCRTDLGRLAQLFAGNTLQTHCSQAMLITYSIYGIGLIGLILFIVGAVVPSSSKPASYASKEKPQETRKEWICEHCKFKTKNEVDLIEHYKEQHADEKGDSYHRKYTKPISSENLEILKRRYAQGEITKEEFEQMKKDLENA